LTRELCTPNHLHTTNNHLHITLPHTNTQLRIHLRRPSHTGTPRFHGPLHEHHNNTWQPINAERLAHLINTELTHHTGHTNDEFIDQVRASLHHIHLATTHHTTHTGTPHLNYINSEQTLIHGHRFHPTPKAHTGSDTHWHRYAPEATTSFPLRNLAIREHLIHEETAHDNATKPLDRHAPPTPHGYRYLPAHPWQWQLLATNPTLQHALTRRDIIDLGPGARPWHPTASVRTLYNGHEFLKFSLAIRITNCIRTNATYELTGSITLTKHLKNTLDTLHHTHPNTTILREPAYRTIALPNPDGTTNTTLFEGLSVILREGLQHHRQPNETPYLAAAIAEEHPHSNAHASHLLHNATPETIRTWWQTYNNLLIPTVLTAYLDHGLILEPHLQNVIVCTDPTGTPTRMIFRDLEGTKLLHHHHTELLNNLPPHIATPLTYTPEQGWNRIAYCLFTNHLTELAATLTDIHPHLETHLWDDTRTTLQNYADQHNNPQPLTELLNGAPLPAKANLITRWNRLPDRQATYIPITSPLTPNHTP
ncbi:iron transporter, partial [Dermatophilus congolensis]|uniref:IucA/IucC family protein n=12 Tax=Dermatophilus congolensis TaxID=1863 RepID=UPI001AB04C30